MAANAGTIKLELVVDDKGSAKIKKFEKGFTKGFKKIGKLAGKVALTVGKIGAAMTAALGAVGAKIIKASIGQFADFEKAMINVSTLVDTSKTSMVGLKKEIMALPAELGSATENAEGLYQALSAGIEPAKAVKFVAEAARAARAGLTDTFTAVDAGTTVLNAFGIQSEHAGMIFDQMFKTVEQGKTTFEALSGSIGKLAPVASAASLKTEEMFAAIATLTKGGFATSEAVARMTTALGAIVKPSKEAAELSAEVGLEFSAAALKAKGLAGFLDSVKVATGGNIEKMAQLFGGMESLSVMLALTGKQSEEFKVILGEIGNSAGAVDTAFAKQQSTLHALWETFKNTVGKQAIILGEKLAPSIKQVIESLSKWINENQGLIKTKIVEFATKFAQAVKWGHDNFKSFIPVLKGAWVVVKGIAKAFNMVGKAIGIATAKIVTFIEKFGSSKIGSLLGFGGAKKAPETTPGGAASVKPPGASAGAQAFAQQAAQASAGSAAGGSVRREGSVYNINVNGAEAALQNPEEVARQVRRELVKLDAMGI